MKEIERKEGRAGGWSAKYSSILFFPYPIGPLIFLYLLLITREKSKKGK